MPIPSPDARLTYDDFVLFPDDGLRHEIIDGAHYVTPSPVLRHQQLKGRQYLAIGNFLEDHPEVGQAFLSTLDTVFSPWDVVEPDLVFVAADQLDILTEPNIQDAPALVVEILPGGAVRHQRSQHADDTALARVHAFAGEALRLAVPEDRGHVGH